ncbi:MAG: acetaldehyde dehydrogenase (acetylating) [Deltaproteobacteria bacterium]|nr:MAG: acetaldehyde dehydrogenase (acetylating) [Deltaproteobacteria bacterium]
MSPLRVAILGSGHIGTDLLAKIHRRQGALQVVAMVGIDPESAGLSRARSLGVRTFHQGLVQLLADPLAAELDLCFDATSAKAHLHHAPLLAERGVRVVDLTPAAVGPYVVPAVNLHALREAPNVNMVTCGGQATVPIVHAVHRVSPVRYAEIVATIASRSAGPGTRANIDEFTRTTARGLEVVGGARRGKAIIILNPAEPPITMRDTVYCLCEPGADPQAIRASIRRMVDEVAAFVPGYRLSQDPVVEDVAARGLREPSGEPIQGTLVTTLLSVEGAGDHLPSYAGNLDIMTSAAVAVGERLASFASSGLEGAP